MPTSLHGSHGTFPKFCKLIMSEFSGIAFHSNNEYAWPKECQYYYETVNMVAVARLAGKVEPRAESDTLGKCFELRLQ